MDISRLNYGIITLLPKIKDANKIQQFRPICLLNCLYKLVTKTLTQRLELIADKLIHSTQTAFMKKKTLYLALCAFMKSCMKQKGEKKLVLSLSKILKKHMIRLIGICYLPVLKRGDLIKKWCSWIKQVITGGTVSVKVINKIGPYIKSFKGVRQGDPLSPILFNFIADCLTRMVQQAEARGLVTGLISHIVPTRVAILQCANDTIVFLRNDLKDAMDMKFLLYLFEMLAGLKINFDKSEIF